jgi:hypothetical protein
MNKQLILLLLVVLIFILILILFYKSKKKNTKEYYDTVQAVSQLSDCGFNITYNDPLIKQSWLYFYLKQSPFGTTLFSPGTLYITNINNNIYFYYKDQYNNCADINLGRLDNNNIGLVEIPNNIIIRGYDFVNSTVLEKIIKNGKTYFLVDKLLQVIYKQSHPVMLISTTDFWSNFGSLGDKARNLVNDIGDFFKDLPSKVRELVRKIISWISSNTETVWNDHIKPILSIIITTVLQGSQCEYLANLNISDLEALQVIEPYIYPELRPVVKRFCIFIIDLVMPEIIPFIELIIDSGLLDQYLNPELDNLIKLILEQFTHEIILITSPIINQLSWTCDWMKPPNIDDVTINDNSMNNLSPDLIII